MFHLAHLSDLHICLIDKMPMAAFFSRRIAGYFNWKMNRGSVLQKGVVDRIIDDILQQKVDHCVMTGDVVNLGLLEEFQSINSLLKNMGDAKEVSFVPGNHDFYVKSSEIFCYQELAPWMQADSIEEETSVYGEISSNSFPYLRVRSEVALIGVLSARSTSLPFWAGGYFSQKQAEKLGCILRDAGEKGLCRVVMIHHPPVKGAVSFSKRLFGIERFAAIIRAYGAELILHGHSHLPSYFMLDGPLGSMVPVVGVASAGQVAGTKKPPAQWNLFEMEKKQKTWHIQLKRRAIQKNVEELQEIENISLK